ncbi:hypothetical protein LQ567_20790 [Niabella pedocola]|uniref:Uncharacterized protein n=1 Tax=Niabella pedocola TaxID=1752077 RepID=A0ABS8PVZ4_9BACT|nr:hypothetical protein [Niabella pedocola]MCD2425236.1 hypothetical protein [Niabella pedocola]
MKQDASYDILNGIRETQQRSPAFTLPDAYFESFTNRLMETVRAQENDTDALNVALDTASREMPYSIPRDYFARFRVNKGERVIPFKKGLAIAASFILLATTSIFLFTQKLQTTATSQASVTATVNQLTDEQLERFIQPDEALLRDQPVPAQAAGTPKADITTLFKNVPDAELSSFLKETAEGNEDIFLN